jgi:tRNA (guanine-N7-)-methyltransferase
MNNTSVKLRTVRSFVRHGRTTASQRWALENLSPRFMLEAPALADLATAFGRDAPKYLEIGFGMGESLARMALAQPEIDFLGIEVHRPGVGKLLVRLEEQGIENVRVLCDDAVMLLQHALPPHTLERIYILFPDPWPKKRHHKRRLIQADFAELLARALKPTGQLHLATDWENYAHHILTVLEHVPTLRNVTGCTMFSPRPQERPMTKFEQRGLRLGHGVWDLIFEAVKIPTPD